jgi:hypothetical protein
VKIFLSKYSGFYVTLVVGQNRNVCLSTFARKSGGKAGYHNVVGTTGFGVQMFEMHFPTFALEGIEENHEHPWSR